MRSTSGEHAVFSPPSASDVGYAAQRSRSNFDACKPMILDVSRCECLAIVTPACQWCAPSVVIRESVGSLRRPVFM